MIKSEEATMYGTEQPVDGDRNTDSNLTELNDRIIQQALDILESRMRKPGVALIMPDAVIDFLRLKLAELEHEIFGVIWLDNRHRVIEYQELARGTIDGAHIAPREVVKAALACNAAAVIFTHNHPSGVAEPSDDDKRITERLKAALGLIDIRVLDHILISGMNSYSFSEGGLM